MIRLVLAAFVALPLSAGVVTTQWRGAAPKCDLNGALVALPQIREASGIAASRRVPGRLWAHKDSGSPVLFALDTRGITRFTPERAAEIDLRPLGEPQGEGVTFGAGGDIIVGEGAKRDAGTFARLSCP